MTKRRPRYTFLCERCGAKDSIAAGTKTRREIHRIPMWCAECMLWRARQGTHKKRKDSGPRSTRGPKARTEPLAKTLKLNGCILRRAGEGKRCSDYFECPHEWSCLCGVIEHGWGSYGWTAKKEKGRMM